MTKARDLADFIASGTIAQTVTADGVDVGDNELIRLGDSQDLRLFHNGSASYISDQGDGNLVLQASEALIVQNGAGTENLLTAYQNGAVSLYHDNSVKIATTSTGVDVTGTIVSDGLTVAASTALVKLEDTDTNAYAQIATDGSGIVNIAADEGSTGASPRITFDVSTTERMRITSSGNVGIGTTNPSQKLDVNGTVNATSFTGDGSGLTGIESGTTTFTATGTIATGDIVALRSDGTVEAVAATNSTNPVLLDTEEITPNFPTSFAGVYDSTNNKIIVFYKDQTNSNQVMGQVGSVSSDVIVFGTPVIVYGSASEVGCAVYDPDQDRALVFLQKYSTDTECYIRTVYYSGTNSLTVEGFTGNIQSTGGLSSYSAVYDTTNNKTVFAFETGGPSTHAFVITLTPGTGTEIDINGQGATCSVANGYQLSSFNCEKSAMTFDSTNSKIVWFSQSAQNNYVYSIVGTVSGSSISFGSLVTYKQNSWNTPCAVFDSNAGKVFVVYQEPNISNRGYAAVGTVSGTSISFGTPSGFETNSTSFTTCAFDPDTNRILIQYRDNTTNAGQSLFATISGTSYTTGSKTTIDSVQYVLPYNTLNKTVYDTSNDRFISVYRDTDADLKSAVISGISSNNSTWIGAAAENISNGSSGSITILGGINEGQTGLTVNTTYYVQGDGTLGTSGSYKIGRAISSTKLFITEGNA